MRLRLLYDILLNTTRATRPLDYVRSKRREKSKDDVSEHVCYHSNGYDEVNTFFLSGCATVTLTKVRKSKKSNVTELFLERLRLCRH